MYIFTPPPVYILYGTALMQRPTRSRFFVESRARVEQTSFSTLTAYRSRNRSRNTKLHHSIQLYRQILSSLAIYSLQSLVSCPYSILNTTHEMKPIAIILEGKPISSILKDFLAWHVLPIQINNRSRDFNKGELDAGHDRPRV